MPEEEEDEAQIQQMLSLDKKKKKKKKKSTSGSTTNAATTATDAAQLERLAAADQDQEMDIVDDRHAEYSYEELLDQVVEKLYAQNPNLVEKKRTRIKPPVMQLLSSKKTLWVNFQEICSMMQRDPAHVYAFFMAELGTEGSIDGNQRLIIRGKYLGKYIESLLRKYVVEYVTCTMCRSANTLLNKDAQSRLFFIDCQDCGSNRSVASIRSGYHATSRADRRAARNRV